MKTTRISFKTTGCRLNQSETARLAAECIKAGCRIVPFGEPADVCVIHGCTVTGHAEKTSLRFARTAGRIEPRPYIILAGCVAEIGGDSAGIAANADLVLGQQQKHDLVNILAQKGFCETPDEKDPATPLFDKTRAWVKVQDGCSFFCSYCIVPYARSNVYSRPYREVISEAEALADAGHSEIVLTGANIGCYDAGGKDLVDLVAGVESLDSVKRIRLSSIEISTVEDRILDYMAGSAKLCKFLHIPLQSGSDRILKLMNRRYTRSDYLCLVDRALSVAPMVGLSTDVLVGFPGEDEAAFADTMTLVENVPFCNLHVFGYSPRPGTRAVEMDLSLSGEVRKERVSGMMRLGKKKKLEFMEKCIGNRVEILVEERGEDGVGEGWTGEYVRAGVTGGVFSSGDLVSAVANSFSGGMLLCSRSQ